MELKDAKGNVIAKVCVEKPNQIECEEGLWVELATEDKTKPMLCAIKPKTTPPYIGFYRDVNSNPVACDLAISFCPINGPMLQVVKGKDIRIISLFDLITNLQSK